MVASLQQQLLRLVTASALDFLAGACEQLRHLCLDQTELRTRIEYRREIRLTDSREVRFVRRVEDIAQRAHRAQS